MEKLSFAMGPFHILMPDSLSAHSVFLNAVRNGFFFPLKCNAFQAGFHGWLRGRGKRVRLSRSYYCAPLSQANLHINHRRPVYNQTYRSSRTPEIRPVCHSNNIIVVIPARAGFICSFQRKGLIGNCYIKKNVSLMKYTSTFI